jgi:hypothetical protein
MLGTCVLCALLLCGFCPADVPEQHQDGVWAASLGCSVSHAALREAVSEQFCRCHPEAVHVRPVSVCEDWWWLWCVVCGVGMGMGGGWHGSACMVAVALQWKNLLLLPYRAFRAATLSCNHSLPLPSSHHRFLFYAIRSGRILAGSEETMQIISGTGEVDLQEMELLLSQFMVPTDMQKLLEGAEAAFNKGPASKMMKPLQVRGGHGAVTGGA